MSTKLNLGRDINGFNVEAPGFSTNCFSATLTTGSASSITIPATSPVWVAYINVESTKKIWVARNTTASIPAGATFSSTTSELVTDKRRYTVYANDTISCITDDATAEVGISLFSTSYP